ncbi:MAG TPA: FixG Ig-like domain-containing protein, partial [Candidatus Obscuribacterales bacterium]
VKKPEGLIRFTSQNELQGKPVNHFRTRVVLLSLVLTGVLSGLVWVLLTRPPVKVTIFNAKNTLYADVNHPQTGSDKDREPELTNQFFVMASNYTFEDGQVRLVAEDPRLEIISPLNPIPVAGGEEKKLGFFVEFPKSVLKLGHGTAVIHLQTRAEDGSWQRELVQEVPLVGPF